MLNSLLKDSLYKNSLWIISSSIVLTGFGFFFWTICTWLFTSEQVGLASTLLAALELLVALSILGLDISLIKYAKSKNRMVLINSCYILAGSFAFVLSLVFIFGIKYISPELLFLKDWGLGAFFVAAVVGYNWYTLTGSFLIGLKKSKFVLVKDFISSSLKLVFPFFFVMLGAYGIFASWSIAILISFFVSLFFFNYKPMFRIDFSQIKKMFRFSSANYIAQFLQRAPRLLLPFLITNIIGASSTAYFHVSFTITSVLFIIPNSISKSLLAEGTVENLRTNVKKAFKFTYALLIPAVIVTVISAKYVLLLFGAEYSDNAYRLLQIFAISSLPFAANLIFIAIRNVQNNVRTVIVANLIIATIALVLSYIFIGTSLLAVAYSFLIAHSVFAVYSIWRVINEK